MNDFKKDVVSGVKWTTLGTIILALVGIVKLSVLARFLDKADFGLMALVTFVMGFMNLFNDMGLTSAILHKQNITAKQYASLYWLNIGFSLLLYILLCGLTPLVSLFYGEPQLNILIPLLGLNLLISAIGRIFKTIQSKHLKFKAITIFEIISAVISLCFAIYLAMNDYGVYTLVYSALLQYSLQNLMYLIYGLKKYGLLLHFKYFETKPFLKIGMYQVGGQIVNYFNRDLDILIIGKFFSQDILGGYSMARELVRRPVSVFGPIINKVGAPTLALYTHKIEELKSNFLELVKIVASISIPLYFLLLIFAEPIVMIIYGEKFLSIVFLVRVLCINMIFRFVGGTIGNLVTATGRTDLEFKWNLITLSIIPFFIFAASFYSINFVAISVTMVSLILYYPSWKFFVKRLINVSFMEYNRAFFSVSLKWLKSLLLNGRK
ncbi:MOP flippase family protein [uncultured Zobellia sp.]|uniref:MOP flippase family protein n=1 Tax=uncultured Zobellia sp. TaxID=255433 RepID=UPI002598BBB0|nr:MOP flippase family protein [uncultured Zobellia sp.]